MAKIREGKSVCIYKDGNFYKFGKKGLISLKKSKAKSYPCGLFIPPEDIFSYTLTLPVDITEDAFDASVEIALFENHTLDLQNAYLIAYKRNLSQKGDLWIVEVFLTEENRVYELYADIAKKVGYIDLIAIPYLIYEAWYIYRPESQKHEIDLIIRLEEKNSFISLYKNGHFIGYQKIYSIEYMSRRIGIMSSKLIDILVKKGLDEDLYLPNEKTLFDKIYALFIDIMRQIDRLIRGKSQYFDLSTIDRVLLDFDGKSIPNFWDILNYYGFPSITQEILKRDINICQIDLECIRDLYLYHALNGDIFAPNLSPFKRKPPFISTWIGRLIISIAISILIIIILGLYYGDKVLDLYQKSIALEQEYKRVKNSDKVYRKTIKELKNDIKLDRELLSEIDNDIVEFEKSIEMLGKLRLKIEDRQKMIKDLNSVMNRYNIMSSFMDINNSKTITIEVIVPYENRYDIASLMSDMKIKGYKSVKTDLISLDKNLYKSRITIIK